MKYTLKRALALLIALILAIPSFALAEEDVQNGQIDAPVDEMDSFELGGGEDDASTGVLTITEEPTTTDPPVDEPVGADEPADEPTEDPADEPTDEPKDEPKDESELFEVPDIYGEEAEDIDTEDDAPVAFLTANGAMFYENVPEGAFVVDFVCDPEDAAIAVYPAATDENPEPEAIEAAGENYWYLFPGDYTYTADAGELSYQEDFTVVDQDMTIEVTLADEKPETFRAVTQGYIYYTLEDGRLVQHNSSIGSYYVPASDGGLWKQSWYVLAENISFNKRIVVEGNVNLILGNNITLYAIRGITVTAGNTLSIYAQSTDENTMGQLIVGGVATCNAAIGGSKAYSAAGNVIIHGGKITVEGGDYAAGIGGGGSSSTTSMDNPSNNGGNVTIYGGVVEAQGGGWGAGIGGGDRGAGGNINIYGGKVTATGGAAAAGLGVVTNGSSATINIRGGQITATDGGYGGAGIGGGGSAISLSWANKDKDFIEASSYQGAVTLQKNFKNNTTGRSIASGAVSDNAALVGELVPETRHVVTFTGGANAAVYNADGEPDDSLTMQALNAGESLTPFYYQAATGYFFPNSAFASGIPEGLTIECAEDASRVDISGTPTGNVKFTMPDTLEPVPYLDEAGNAQVCIDYATVNSNTRTWGDGTSTPKWYVVKTDVTISKTIEVSGNAHLILVNGATLTVSNAGIHVVEGNSLTIYGQADCTGALSVSGGSEDLDTYAAIGSRYQEVAGSITINGGNITANAARYSAGIGGGFRGSGGDITINGGSVTAIGGGGAADIGVGYYGGTGGTITINGGKVNANYSMGIGGGNSTISLSWSDADEDYINVSSYAGTVTLSKNFKNDSANSYIPSGVVSNNGTLSGKLVPCGYIVTFTGGANADVCEADSGLQISGLTMQVVNAGDSITPFYYQAKSGYFFRNSDFDSVVIPGGFSVRQSDDDRNRVEVSGAPVGNATIEIPDAVEVVDYLDGAGVAQSCDDYESVTASTTAWTTGWYVVDETVEISDRVEVTGDVHLILRNDKTLTASNGIHVTGDDSLTIYGQTNGTGALTASAGGNQAGIGGNGNENSGTITINGGSITATGGDDAAGIGGANSTITINGGKITADSIIGDTVSLPWTTKASDFIDVSSYSGEVTLVKDFMTTVGIILQAGTALNNDALAGKLVPSVASSVDYIDASGTTVTITPDRYKVVTPAATNWSEGLYVVDKAVEISSRIGVSGDVSLILKDDKTLTASKGIYVGEGNSLTIYGQTNGTGALTITDVDEKNAGIGGNDGETGGTIAINGGAVTAFGGEGAYGISGTLSLGNDMRIRASSDNSTWSNWTTSIPDRQQYMQTRFGSSV